MFFALTGVEIYIYYNILICMRTAEWQYTRLWLMYQFFFKSPVKISTGTRLVDYKNFTKKLMFIKLNSRKTKIQTWTNRKFTFMNKSEIGMYIHTYTCMHLWRSNNGMINWYNKRKEKLSQTFERMLFITGICEESFWERFETVHSMDEMFDSGKSECSLFKYVVQCSEI